MRGSGLLGPIGRLLRGVDDSASDRIHIDPRFSCGLQCTRLLHMQRKFALFCLSNGREIAAVMGAGMA